ncbi:type II toxin-antitoxin system HipA family toxin [Acinetobacter seifertii]|uniref:type II toxin-antitoxin system HipA family toxin n=1 Tax=Acinetobacter seifertii TaxID=1530123 RepID=UPI001C0D5184|nr:type II toxin-antitoxin system HipA family toxin [Acinetobacter seifertii]MBU3086488.1 type II toxin-antitoxin system HipA family toxin [Acinetobacter seifertii]UKC63875.1 Serine/threonine-protein kinase toxin HipA [Acinetobacter seifertii]
MLNRLNVYYNGWGESWLWGTLISSTATTGRPTIAFEYSPEAIQQGVELSSYLLPLKGLPFRQGFPTHQMGLPGPVYDALPDGWGMLLMDRYFRKIGLHPARISPLERLTYISTHAMGALSFEPCVAEMQTSENIPLPQLAQEVQEVLKGEGGEFLQHLLVMGGSPQGARPKALVYRDPVNLEFSTQDSDQHEAWLIKFPAQQEHPEVCAIEAVYAECLRLCAIETPDTHFFNLPNGLTAFASKRFDRQNGMRIPMQSLAAYTGADYKVPGSLDYRNFLRATLMCTQDVRERLHAFKRAVFNVLFNNRDDHTKNFSFLMEKNGQWKLAPAYDVTFCEGPGGYHQMDIMGEALNISRNDIHKLGTSEANLTTLEVDEIILTMREIALQFSQIAQRLYPHQIRESTLQMIQSRIQQNIDFLTET